MPTSKEDIKALIQQYADNCGNATIIGTIGTGGTSWQGDAEQGLLSVCDGLANTINEQINIAMQIRHDCDAWVIGEINTHIVGKLIVLTGIVADLIGQPITPPSPLDMTGYPG